MTKLTRVQQQNKNIVESQKPKRHAIYESSFTTKQYIFEAKLFEAQVMRHPIYESAYTSTKYLAEARLTPAQIQQIFANIAAKMAGAKTILGKAAGVVGKAGAAVGAAWGKVKSAIQNSGPVAGFDNKVEQLQTSIMNKLGGKGGAIGKGLEKYKNFAKAYPIMQGAILAVFIAALGASAGGGVVAVGAIAGGMKLVDRLLQGDKASSALWSGFKAGAVGAAGAAAAQAMQGGAEVAKAATHHAHMGATHATDYVIQKGDTLSDLAQKLGTSVKVLQQANPDITDVHKIFTGQHLTLPPGVGQGALHQAIYQDGVGLAKAGGKAAARAAAKAATKGALGESRYIEVNKTVRFRQLAESRGLVVDTIYFTPIGVRRIFDDVVTEGMWDRLKTGVSNLTTKVTADKLTKGWSKMSPDGSGDSEKVKEFLRSQGVKDEVINTVISKTGKPLSQTASAVRKRTPKTPAAPAPAAPAAPAPAAPAAKKRTPKAPAAPAAAKPAPAAPAAPTAADRFDGRESRQPARKR